jgi:hypothetical protein
MRTLNVNLAGRTRANCTPREGILEPSRAQQQHSANLAGLIRRVHFYIPKGERKIMNKIEQGQKIRAWDFAQALAEQGGTYLVTRPGTTLIVVCEEGHSIRSVRAVGGDWPMVALGGLPTAMWEIERLNSSSEITPEAALAGGLVGAGTGQQRRT